MSQRTFQALLARLVVDPDFRERVSSEGDRALGGTLDGFERRRLLFAAGHKGIDITRTLHKGFRLGKILSMLPITSALMGNKRLVREINHFWRVHSSRSFYYLEEAIAFCGFIQNRIRDGLRITYLEEVIGYERARLELQRPLPGEEARESLQVRFSHDPERLLMPLARGRQPRGVPKKSCTLTGTLGSDGSIEWTITAEENRGDAAVARRA